MYQFEKTNVSLSLYLPKFTITSDTDIISGLKSLGVNDVFNSKKADFSPVISKYKGCYVSAINHAVKFQTDENGCRGAAYTSINANVTGGATPEIDFILDRPFLFVVTSADGLPVFAGVVNQPKY